VRPVEYTAPSSTRQPWRTTAIAASAIAAVELCLLLVIGVTLAAKPFADKVRTEADKRVAAANAGSAKQPATGGKAKVVAKLARNRTSVMVLNGNGVPGAAGSASDRIRRFRYIIAGAANAPRSNFARSMIMYRHGFRGEALRLGHDLGVKRVVPLDGLSRADLGGAHLALIVGSK
jgi:LytR cell envelope-related transcriptional attenuator